MFIDFLLDTFRTHAPNEAIVWKNTVFSYEWLLKRCRYWQDFLRQERVLAGSVTIVEGDFSPNSVALMLALLENGCIFVPLSKAVSVNKIQFMEIAQGQILFELNEQDEAQFTRLPYKRNHPLYEPLMRSGHPGLVLFSSGSTGESKAAVHDASLLLIKHHKKRQIMRMITFLLFDHIGGLNTLLYALSNGGCVVVLKDRSPEAVCKAIQAFRVEGLPVSPSFLNLLMMSGECEHYDLSSLKAITYGTEVMPASTLKRCRERFPNVIFQQTYGTTEIGILRSKSKSSDSLWVKIGGEGFETRIVDGILQIKAQSAMLGYLNAASPFTEDGWFHTGDLVETDGEYFRIIGRKSEIINVGGQKVHPAEVESVIGELENISDVTVYREPNPILGNIVCAKVSLQSPEDEEVFESRLRKHCRDRLERFKVPVKIEIVDGKHFSERFKKIRLATRQTH